MVYLDYAANTVVDKEVLDLYYDVSLKYFANPNSIHKLGVEAKNQIDMATNKIAKILNCLPEEVIYTSGATESNNLAIIGLCEKYKNFGKHIIISSLEHTSIVAPVNYLTQQGFEVDVLNVSVDGKVSVDELKKLIRDDTILVSITSVDSELGIKQPIEEIGEVLKDYPNTHFHTDSSQAIGKVKMDFTNVDLVTIAPHKFYGLNGFGILIKKKDVLLKPIILGGKSTTIYRSGTPVLPMVVANAYALEKAINNQDKRDEYVGKLNKEVISFLEKHDKVHINNTNNSVIYTINFSIKGVNSEEFIKKLSDNDIYMSPKTSCCPNKTPSKHVLALTNDKSLAKSSMRLSLSHLTTEEDLNTFYEVFDKLYGEI